MWEMWDGEVVGWGPAEKAIELRAGPEEGTGLNLGAKGGVRG